MPESKKKAPAAKSESTPKKAAGGAKASAKSAEGGGGRASKAKSGGDDNGSKPRGGLAQEVTPDATLAAVIGAGSATRAEITKRIWAYIKKNGLQDQQNRRAINADDRLRPIFGGKNQVSMFEMTALVNKHMQPA